jgi:hypothetical protein
LDIIEGIGPNEAEEKDQGKEYLVRDFEYLDPEANQGKVEDEEKHIAQV